MDEARRLLSNDQVRADVQAADARDSDEDA
jgi:hypothetical protein